MSVVGKISGSFCFPNLFKMGPSLIKMYLSIKISVSLEWTKMFLQLRDYHLFHLCLSEKKWIYLVKSISVLQ